MTIWEKIIGILSICFFIKGYKRKKPAQLAGFKFLNIFIKENSIPAFRCNDDDCKHENGDIENVLFHVLNSKCKKSFLHSNFLVGKFKKGKGVFLGISLFFVLRVDNDGHRAIVH